MRGLVAVCVSCWSASLFGANAAPEDDPKLARPGAFVELWAVADTDDPKMERGPRLRLGPRWQDREVARIKLAYRFLKAHPLEDVDMTFHGFELDYYPFS